MISGPVDGNSISAFKGQILEEISRLQGANANSFQLSMFVDDALSIVNSDSAWKMDYRNKYSRIF